MMSRQRKAAGTADRVLGPDGRFYGKNNVPSLSELDQKELLEAKMADLGKQLAQYRESSRKFEDKCKDLEALLKSRDAKIKEMEEAISAIKVAKDEEKSKPASKRTANKKQQGKGQGKEEEVNS